MKFFGRLMTALAVLATLLAIFIVASPTLLGKGADCVFWDLWGRIYWGDHVSVSLSADYVDSEGTSRGMNLSDLPVNQVSGDAEVPCTAASDGMNRLLRANGRQTWAFTLDNALRPDLPDGSTRILLTIDAAEKQFADATVSVAITAQTQGNPTVEVTVTKKTRSQSEPAKTTTVSGTWGSEITVSFGEA